MATCDQRAEWEARIEEIDELLPILHANYKERIAQSVDQYTFDSSEGMQKAKRVSLSELKEQIDSLRAERDQLCRKLKGGGVVNMNVRRNPGYCGGRLY